MGSLGSIYGLFVMVLYFFGGFLVDCILVRKLFLGFLIIIGIFGFVLIFYFLYIVVFLIYVLWGIIIIFIFWLVFVKVVRMLVFENE